MTVLQIAVDEDLLTKAEVDPASLGLDVKILLLTVKTVFVREGISAHGDATMPEFNPSRPGVTGSPDSSR